LYELAQINFVAIYEMSELLHTGLNRESLLILAELCDEGVNPYALAQGKPFPSMNLPFYAVVRELHAEKEAARLRRESGNASKSDGGR